MDRFSILALLLFLLSCSNPQEIEGFDAAGWQKDKMACQDTRSTLLPSLIQQQSKLIGLSQKDLIVVLGKPDNQELYKRNQKFYIYYIDAGPACNAKNNAKDRRKLKIRISPIGLTNEVSIYSEDN